MNGKEALAPLTADARRKEARRHREQALQLSEDIAPVKHENNGEESEYLEKTGIPVANFSKGLPHNERGEVHRDAYEALRKALRSGKQEDFEKIPLGTVNGRKLTNPQAGLAFELQGPDPQAVTVPPAPRLDSKKNVGEMVELYWMALLRDVPFTRFADDKDVAAAAAELEKYRDVFDLPFVSRITPATVFRGRTKGDIQGPVISQFLLRDVPFGSLTINQRQSTVVPGRDYLTDFGSWLAVQNGVDPGGDVLDPVPRYIRNMRDMARYVHIDALHEAYFNAALILLAERGGAVDQGMPYRTSRTQIGFGTFGGPHILTLLTEVSTRALRAVWFQKWNVHRRLRPEEFGGRVDVHRRKLAQYPITAELLQSEAHQRVLSRYGSSLLPQAFPEGSPTHPAYGAGHATVAGACVTILKAWFDGGLPLGGRAVVPDESGTQLVDYTGPDAGRLTIGGELDKLTANIAVGRDMAGVHWRSDYTESLRLGERVALELLRQHSTLYNEPNVFTLLNFDNRTVKVRDGKIQFE